MREETKVRAQRGTGTNVILAIMMSQGSCCEPCTYLQNLKRIFSNTRTGPVLPRMVRG